jgi:hypothetical protein
VLGNREYAFTLDACPNRAADLTDEYWVLAEAFTCPTALRHSRNVQARRQERILASGEDLPAERGTVTVCQFLIEARRDCQAGREGRRTLVPAYRVRSVAVVEGYKVLRADRCEVVQRDASLSSPDSRPTCFRAR